MNCGGLTRIHCNRISLPVVPQKVGPPFLTKAVRSGRPALTLTWTAPQSERPIIKYQVQYRRTGIYSWSTRDVRARSVTVENLSPGTSYQVQVRAVSDVGSGPFSDVRILIAYRGLLNMIQCIFVVMNIGCDNPLSLPSVLPKHMKVPKYIAKWISVISF